MSSSIKMKPTLFRNEHNFSVARASIRQLLFKARARHVAADDEVRGTKVLPDDPRNVGRFRGPDRVTAGKEQR